MKSVKDRIPAPSQDASRWLRGLPLLIWLLMPGQPSTAEDFWILGRTESNLNYLLEFPSLTSEYHLVSTCSRLCVGLIVPEPSPVARFTSKREATSDRFGTMKTSL